MKQVIRAADRHIRTGITVSHSKLCMKSVSQSVSQSIPMLIL